jgi:hypothetical protein
MIQCIVQVQDTILQTIPTHMKLGNTQRVISRLAKKIDIIGAAPMMPPHEGECR